MATPVTPKLLTDSSKSLIANRPVTSIRPPKGFAALNFLELWEYRELLYFLVWRDVKVRYKQTVIGVAWAVLQPLLTMVVFSIVFGQLIQVPTGEAPYLVFTYVALLPWTFFAGAISRSGSSLIYDANLISKVYFPRVIIPIAAILSNLVDFGCASTVLIGMMLILGMVPGALILTLPLFLLLALMTALAIGLWLSALNVKYRDINYAIPFLVQIWLFLTPVAYPVTIIPDRWRLLYSLNPMVGVVEGFRWALLGQQNLSWTLMLLSTLLILVLLVGGMFYFRRMEFEFADVV
jgi:lipopolysaccharide transport system permease protein